MLQKPQHNPRRTEQEWMDLVQECRTSGLSDKEWCNLHHIHRSNLYYHIRKLRSRACAVPDGSVPSLPNIQEVVRIPLTSLESRVVPEIPRQNTWSGANETAIRINFHGISLEITNTAASDTITNTISALQRLC